MCSCSLVVHYKNEKVHYFINTNSKDKIGNIIILGYFWIHELAFMTVDKIAWEHWPLSVLKSEWILNFMHKWHLVRLQYAITQKPPLQRIQLVLSELWTRLLSWTLGAPTCYLKTAEVALLDWDIYREVWSNANEILIAFFLNFLKVIIILVIWNTKVWCKNEWAMFC